MAYDPALNPNNESQDQSDQNQPPTPPTGPVTTGDPTGKSAAGQLPTDPANILPTQASPTPPAWTPPSGPITDPAALTKVIQTWAASHPGYNPSVTSDTNYWVQRMLQTHPDGNIDWGYWQSRFMQPEGAPEGSGTTSQGPPTPPPGPTDGFTPLDPNLTGGINDVLSVIKGDFQKWYGRPMTDDELSALEKQYGYQPDTPASGGTSATTNKLDPSMSGSSDQAVSYINQEAQRVLGRPLTQDEIQKAATSVGYQQGQPVTGTMVNSILSQIDAMAPKTGGTAAVTHTYTGAQINPILQQLYNNRPKGGPGTGGGGGTGTGTGGGGTTNTGGGGGTTTINTSGTSFNPLQSELMQMLMGRASQSLNIDPNTDPIIKAQVDAANAQGIRSGRNQINDLAESGNPYMTGALTTARTQADEANAQNVTGLQSQLTQNELTARRQEIQDSLTEMGGLLTSDQQLQLQKELGLLDEAIKQQQVGNQNTQFYAGLGQNNSQFLQNLLLQYGYLNSQNDQFAQNYNLNATQAANYWDAVRRGLI